LSSCVSQRQRSVVEFLFGLQPMRAIHSTFLEVLSPRSGRKIDSLEEFLHILYEGGAPGM
jgi:hypothetical protein